MEFWGNGIIRTLTNNHNNNLITHSCTNYCNFAKRPLKLGHGWVIEYHIKWSFNASFWNFAPYSYGSLVISREPFSPLHSPWNQAIVWFPGIIRRWVRSRNCGCLVTWFCYQLIAKPGNETVTVSWLDPDNHRYNCISSIKYLFAYWYYELTNHPCVTFFERSIISPNQCQWLCMYKIWTSVLIFVINEIFHYFLCTFLSRERDSKHKSHTPKCYNELTHQGQVTHIFISN